MSELPVLRFPIHLQLQGNLADFSGELCGLYFKDGITTQPYNYRHVQRVTAGFGVMKHPRSGLLVSPIHEDRTYKVDHANKFWIEYHALPEVFDKAIEEDGSEYFEVVDSPDAPVQEAEAAPDQSPEGEKNEEQASLFELPSEAPSQPVDTDAAAPVEVVVAAEPVVVVGDDEVQLRNKLADVALAKGVRTLREILKSRGVEKPPRAGEEVIDALVKLGFTLDEANKL